MSLLQKNKISAAERNRVLDYLTFKIKHGANITTALRSYMEGNRTKASRPVRTMLEDMAEGTSFHDAALAFGLVDRYGFLVLNSGIEASKSLPVVRDIAVKMNFGVTVILIRELVTKYVLALLLAASMASQAVRAPLIKIFDTMNGVTLQTGAAPFRFLFILKPHGLSRNGCFSSASSSSSQGALPGGSTVIAVTWPPPPAVPVL
jgi:hypothetical protein